MCAEKGHHGHHADNGGTLSPVVESPPSRSNSVDSTVQPTLGDRTVSSSSTATTSTTASKKKLIRASWSGNKKKGEFDLNANNDIIGIVMLEIGGAANLPKLKNSKLCVSTYARLHAHRYLQ